MFKYIIKRILIFIPTLLIISVMVFMLNMYAPGDPVYNMAGIDPQSSKPLTPEAYASIKKDLGLDKPPFYFTLGSKAYPDTLYRIPKKEHQNLLSRLVGTYGNWDEVRAYHKSIGAMESAVNSIPKDSLNPKALIKIKERVRGLYALHVDDRVQNNFEVADRYITSTPSTSVLSPLMADMKSKYASMVNNPTTWKLKVPKFNWYGLNNQYHTWFSKFIRFDFGKSYQSKRPISEEIGERIYWTMLISIISLIIVYLLSIPLGVFSARKKDTRADSVVTTILFVLYSLPSFWIATLLIVFMCNPEYLEWFPPYGVGDVPEGTGFFKTFRIRAYHLILPLFCWSYGSLAFLSRQMRGGMLSVLRQDYVRTARAKGVDERKVVWKHAIRNSLLPIITLFGNIFPLMISGSIVIEIIFSLPGMGQYLYQAIVFKNFPVVSTIVMMLGFLTMLGFLIVDILYAVVDPRIKFD